MSKVYFTSDLHFGDKTLCNIIRNMSAEESDELIVSNWNKTVNKRDKIYILGDITTTTEIQHTRFKELNGDIVLIGGNHDLENIGCKLGIDVIGALEYKGFICTHIPIHPNETLFYKGNLHGHLHSSSNLGPEYFNVNVEFNNYTPVLFEDIVKHFDDKSFKTMFRKLTIFTDQGVIVFYSKKYTTIIYQILEHLENCEITQIDRITMQEVVVSNELNSQNFDYVNVSTKDLNTILESNYTALMISHLFSESVTDIIKFTPNIKNPKYDKIVNKIIKL